MSEKNRRRLMLGVAAIHLLLVAFGAAKVSFDPLGPPGQLLDHYGLLSGAGSGYGFFASGIGSQLRARFDVVDGQGQRSITSLETAASHEADLRISHITDEFWNDDETGGLQRSLAASFAGKIFARYPQAHEVVVRLEQFTPASMEEFRRGSRPQWTPLYEAKFVYQNRQKKE